MKINHYNTLKWYDGLTLWVILMQFLAWWSHGGSGALLLLLNCSPSWHCLYPPLYPPPPPPSNNSPSMVQQVEHNGGQHDLVPQMAAATYWQQRKLRALPNKLLVCHCVWSGFIEYSVLHGKFVLNVSVTGRDWLEVNFTLQPWFFYPTLLFPPLTLHCQ